MIGDFQRIIIIGGNAAGPAAAAKAKRVNPTAEVILFEQSPFISTGTCELPYLFSGAVKDYTDIVFYDQHSFQKEKNVKVYTRYRAEKIIRQNKTVVVRDIQNDSLHEFDYDKLILTTGSTSKKIPDLYGFPQNLFYLKNIPDFQKIDNYLKAIRVNKIVVIGAGYIGLELSHTLREKGYDILLLEKENLPLPGSEVEIQHLILELLKKNNIEFIGGLEKIDFNISGEKIKSIKIGSRLINFDIAITAIGFRPNNALAETARLRTGHFDGLTVDNRLRTSDNCIYAAGDNIEVINFITGRPDYLPLATFAHKFGHIAGANAAGGNMFAKPVIKNLSFQLFEQAISSVGLSTQEAVKYGFKFDSVHALAQNLVKVMPGSGKVFGKLIYDRGTLEILGASFYGGKEVIGYADLIASYIHHKLKATTLEDLGYNYTPPLSPFVNLLSVLGRKVKNAGK